MIDMLEIVDPEDLMNLPVGTVIMVQKKDTAIEYQVETRSLWVVWVPGKAQLINEHYPHSETEDLDWFESYEVKIIPVDWFT